MSVHLCSLTHPVVSLECGPERRGWWVGCWTESACHWLICTQGYPTLPVPWSPCRFPGLAWLPAQPWHRPAFCRVCLYHYYLRSTALLTVCDTATSCAVHVRPRRPVHGLLTQHHHRQTHGSLESSQSPRLAALLGIIKHAKVSTWTHMRRWLGQLHCSPTTGPPCLVGCGVRGIIRGSTCGSFIIICVSLA